jgi:hypothetical protein
LIGLRNELLCSWDLSARFLHRENEWVLAWKVENWGVKTEADDRDAWWAASTEAGQKDAIRLAAMFRATPRPSAS